MPTLQRESIRLYLLPGLEEDPTAEGVHPAAADDAAPNDPADGAAACGATADGLVDGVGLAVNGITTAEAADDADAP